MHKCLEEAVLRVALRNNLIEVVKRLHDYLSEPMHLEYAFYVIKQVLRLRAVQQYSLISDLLQKLCETDLPSTSQQLQLLRIQRSAAFIVLMGDVAGINQTSQLPLSTKEVLRKMKHLLPHTNKYSRLDETSRESRIALMLTMMKQKRILRLRRDFHSKAERLSEKMEKCLDKVRAEMLVPLNGLPLENYFASAEAAKNLYMEIVKKEGVSDRSLLKFLRIIEDSPQMSFSFFDSGSCEVFPA